MALSNRRLPRPRPSLLAVAAALLLSPAAMVSGQAPAPMANPTAIPSALTAAEQWEAQSFIDDPANLKRERSEPRDADALLPVDQGRSGVEQMLRKLNTRASLLMIVAHPDDEDGGMLTYVSRGLGARVGILTLTRGEGGQNVMSGDFDDALGLVRTRELLAADRYFAVDQMFGTEADFGFSKTIEEAFGKWTHQRVLYDAVRAVRLYRPLVVASVFIGAVTDGHGQHQVSGEIAQEVFRAAADPKVFPEMGLPAWQVQKVYGRVPFATVDQRGMYDYATGKYLPARFHNYVTGAWSTAAPQATVTIPEGNTDPLLGGLSYVQFARQGLALQRTQIGSGMRVPPAGRFDVGYTRYGAVPSASAADHETSFFDHIETSLTGVAGLAPSLSGEERTLLLHHLQQLATAVATARKALAGHDDHAGESALAIGLRTLDTTIANIDRDHRLPSRERYDVLHELRVKRAQCNDALVAWLGVSVSADVVKDGAGSESSPPIGGRQDESAPRIAVPGQRLNARIEVRNAGDQDLRLSDHTAQFARGIGAATIHALAPGPGPFPAAGTHTELLALTIKPDAPLSRPFFTRKNSEQPFYDVNDPRLRNAPVTPPALVAWETVFYSELPLAVGAPVKVRPQTSQAGAVKQLLTVVPAVSISIDPRAGVVPEGQKTFPVRVAVAAEGRGSAGGSVRLELPRGWTASPERAPFLAGTSGQPAEISFDVIPAQLSKKPFAISAVAEFGGREYREGVALTGYPGLVRDDLYAPAEYTVRGVNIHVPDGLRVAFLPGTGDAVAASLGSVGIHPVAVSVADIAAGRLAGFDALLLGVRAYAAHKDLASVTAKLLDFAKAGGAVVVQYNSAEYDNNYGPYPYSLTGAAEKVVEEDAPVHLLAPSTQALSWPNQLSPDDFAGWVEERGHGFMHSWDPRYTALTEVHDEGQDPQRGGLLVAPVGRGAYVYCAFALYRQMPAGVPGAYRILVNLLSLGRHPK